MKSVSFCCVRPRRRGQVLQLAIQAVTPRQGEVEGDFPVESFSLLPLFILAIAVL